MCLAQANYPDNVIETDCTGTMPATQWSIREAWYSTQTNVSTYVPPVSGDLDGDGIPEIVTSKYNTSNLVNGIYIFWGNNRNNPTLISTPDRLMCPATIIAKVNIGTASAPVLKSLIFTLANDGYLYAYDPLNPTNYYWKSNVQTIAINGASIWQVIAMNITDFNSDGFQEVYFGKYIFAAESGKLLYEMPATNNCGKDRQVDNVEHSVYCNIAADVTGDGRPELLAGTQVYSINITNRNGTAGNSATLIKSILDVDMGGGYFIKDGKTVVADINRDGRLDVVVVATLGDNTFGIIAWDVQTQTLIAKTTSNVTNASTGVPFIGNIDNEPNVEIVLLSRASYGGKIEGFRYNGTTTFQKVYSTNVNDNSGQTGMTIFDFNNDGIEEIVYRDEQNLHIMHAQPNNLGVGTFIDIATFPATSGTSWEYPIVADVDNDGEAEIITVGGNSGTSPYGNGRLRIYKSNGSPWVSARKVWNQYGYNVVNVNNDLTIPQYQFNPATPFPGPDHILGTSDDIQPFNNFLQQQPYLNQYGEPLWNLGYIRDTINDTICEGDSYDFYGQILTTAGTYTDTIPSIENCDTIVTLNLTILPYQTRILYDTICESESYDFYGTILTEAGTFIDTVFVTYGCDTIVTLNLEVVSYRTKTINNAICEGESYDFYGTILTEAGTFTDTVFVTYGCDTIVTLNLDILPYKTKIITDTVCRGDSYDFYGQILTTSGTYIDTISAVAGCDTIVTLNIYFKYCGQIDVELLGEICADDPFITLNYIILEGNSDCYSIAFNRQALDEGFEDIVCQPLVSPITIPIPQGQGLRYVRPNHNYSITVTFEYETDIIDTHTLFFDILYPSWIIEQKWNDVLALLNQYYNGGYEWSAYEWYADTVKIPVDRGSYIYTPDYGKATLDFGREYRALLTRTDDGVQIFTCPFVPTQHTDITTYPTIVSSSSLFGITSRIAGKVSLITVTGIKLAEYQLIADEENLISAPYAAGVYILVFEYKNGTVETKKIVVK